MIKCFQYRNYGQTETYTIQRLKVICMQYTWTKVEGKVYSVQGLEIKVKLEIYRDSS